MDQNTKQQYQQCIQKASTWFLNVLQDDGHLNPKTDDILEFYCLPFLYANLGQKEPAYRVLNTILKSFTTLDGGMKRKFSDSSSKAMSEHLPKAMSWLGIAAHQLGRYEISYPFSRYLRNYYDPEQGAFTALAPYGRVESVLDVFSSTMMGWFALMLGDLKKAQRAGNFLQRGISLQTTKDQVFYLRMEPDGKIITNCAKEEIPYYWVTNQKAENNLHYIALATIFLGKLYNATQEESYLRTAQAYQETAFSYSHEPDPVVGWGAAVLANITEEKRYEAQANEILLELISKQSEEGNWAIQSQEREYFYNALFTIAINEACMELSVV